MVAKEALAISQLTVRIIFIPEPTTAYLGIVDEFICLNQMWYCKLAKPFAS
jgi:hypothetical protein